MPDYRRTQLPPIRSRKRVVSADPRPALAASTSSGAAATSIDSGLRGEIASSAATSTTSSSSRFERPSHRGFYSERITPAAGKRNGGSPSSDESVVRFLPD